MSCIYNTKEELKQECFELAEGYVGFPFSDDLESRICSALTTVLLESFEQGLLRDEPTDVRVERVSCIGVLQIFHGKFFLADWIDKVWRGPSVLVNVEITGEIEV